MTWFRRMTWLKTSSLSSAIRTRPKSRYRQRLNRRPKPNRVLYFLVVTETLTRHSFLTLISSSWSSIPLQVWMLIFNTMILDWKILILVSALLSKCTRILKTTMNLSCSSTMLLYWSTAQSLAKMCQRLLLTKWYHRLKPTPFTPTMDLVTSRIGLPILFCATSPRMSRQR